jgi:hypothetical protein
VLSSAGVGAGGDGDAAAVGSGPPEESEAPEEQALKIEATSAHAIEHRAARVKLSASTWPPSPAPQQ